ncbi:MAG: hypothetical protein K8L99_25505 [Anaerolineae bacterium]|nr:hypothetical protein [Anaerolineae bacterium]
MSNIFDLKAPELYRCQVYRYFNGLSRLYVGVFKPYQSVPAFYFLFSDVGYFEGPVNWQGADFDIAPDEECIDLMLRCGMIGEAILTFPNAYASITETARLYRARTQNIPVQIIASSVTMLNEIPDNI